MIPLILAMIIWGSIGAVVLFSGLSAIEASFFRCLLGALFLLPYCWHKDRLRLSKYGLKQLSLVALGGVFIVLNWVLLFQSFVWASITLGNVSYYLQPVFLVILGIIFFREVVSYRRWAWIMLTVLGVLLTIDIDITAVDLDASKLLGVACALGAGLLYAFATIVAKFIRDIPPSLMTLIQLLIGCVLLAPFIDLSQLQVTPRWLGYVMVLGGVHTALAYILYYRGVKMTNVTNIAIIGYIDPIVAIFTDIVFFDSKLSILQMLGIILTMLGSYFVIKLAGSRGEASKLTQPSASS